MSEATSVEVYGWVNQTGKTGLEAFLARPNVARIATMSPSAGPQVAPVWFLWEGGAFWWLTGSWSSLTSRLERDPRVALVVDTCDLATGRVLQVSVSGRAEVLPLDRELAVRKLSKYLGSEISRWPQERFLPPLDDPTTRLVRLRPDRDPVLRDLSF